MKQETHLNIPLRCSCGKVSGQAQDVSPHDGQRLICYCDDCQIYAHHLKRGKELLDDHGGTDIFQLNPSQLHIETGHPLIKCLQLGPKGLRRFYASCCNTPVANMVAHPKVPLAGVPHLFMDLDALAREASLGPVLFRVQGRFAQGDVPSNVHPKIPFSCLTRSTPWLLRSWYQKRYAPFPFETTGSSQLPGVVPEHEYSVARDAAGFAVSRGA